MFLRNRTPHDVALARGHASDELAIASVNLEVVYAIRGQQLEPLEPPPPRAAVDPPDATRIPLWSGTSVTLSGVARGPARAPHVCPVAVAVGTEMRRLIVFGERRWTRPLLGGPLQASPALPFDAVPLTWDRAFGGAYDLEPGVLPGSALPHPGGRVAFPLNAGGIGFYPDERAALDQLLPPLELPDQLIKAWGDRPEPAGFAPCPQLASLRLPSAPPEPEHDRAWAVTAALRMLHHAPGRLIFAALAPATPVEVTGLGEPVRFACPPSPIVVSCRKGRDATPVPGRLRSVHVDMTALAVRISYGHQFPYPPDAAPSWIAAERR